MVIALFYLIVKTLSLNTIHTMVTGHVEVKLALIRKLLSSWLALRDLEGVAQDAEVRQNISLNQQ